MVNLDFLAFLVLKVSLVCLDLLAHWALLGLQDLLTVMAS